MKNMTLRKIAGSILPQKIKQYIRKQIAPTNPFAFHFQNTGSSQEVPSPFNFVVDIPNPLVELGERYQPTKRKHNYLPYYWMHFRDIRDSVQKVLEIGVQTDRSLRMWQDFFPAATIYGIDIDPACKKFENARCKIFIGDQGDPELLAEVIRAAGPFDIVIDDGSHTMNDQLRSLEYLFPALTAHGIYVIEDIGVGDTEHLTLNALKQLVDHINYWPHGFASRDWPSLSTFPETATWPDRHVIGIAFYRYIAFILKGSNPEDNPHLGRQSSS
jgi:hypothetical protein